MKSAICWITLQSVVCSVCIADNRTDVSGIAIEAIMMSSRHVAKSRL